MENSDQAGGARSAVIVGAASGIGEALARRLAGDGWRVMLLARRVDRLKEIAESIGRGAEWRAVDVSRPEEAVAVLMGVFADSGPIDLVVISSGTGSLNSDLQWEADRETIAVNVVGFTAVAQAAMRCFIERGAGHLVGITSVAALRGTAAAAAYSASKAYQSVYLDSLRDLVRSRRLPITVTEIQPGFVDTAMMKPGRPLSPLLRRLVVSTPQKAADQITAAIRRKAKHAYVSRRYALIAAALKCLPRPG